MNKKGSSLTSVIIAALFGIMALMLAFSSYSGILVNNNATIGSDITEFQAQMQNVSASFNQTSGQFINASGNPETTNFFTKVADFGDAIVSYLTIGWGAIDIFSNMGDNFKATLNAMSGSITWIDATLYSTIAVALIIWIAFMILRGKKSGDAP